MNARRFATLAATSTAATIVALVLAVGGVEVWTRLTWKPLKGVPGFFLSDPIRGQRLAPGYVGWFAGVPVRLNSLALRDDREYSLAKSSRTFRILVLGDSVTFGHGSVYEHSYPYLLERELRRWRPDVDWQVWNAAVPGYNTSQELAQLLEVGDRFQPDLVVVGFFWNDVVGNFAMTEPGKLARASSVLRSFLYRHVYSIELYKRVYLQLASRLSASARYKERLEHLSEERELLGNVAAVQALKAQQLTPFDRLTDEEVAAIECRSGPTIAPDTTANMQREPGWSDWLDAVHRFQQLNRSAPYRVAFFINIVPIECATGDAFHDGGSADFNRFFVNILGSGAPAVSVYEEFRHLRPSQMPLAAGHAIGNTNLVKANVLFRFLRDHMLLDVQRTNGVRHLR